MPKLLLKFDASVIQEIKLDRPLFTVGRKPDNDIVLDNTTVSGHHCKIYESGGTWFVEDLNSTNGTFVNGKKVFKVGLRNNDSISIVKYSLKFIADPKAPGAPAAPKQAAPEPPKPPAPEAKPGAEQPQKDSPQGNLEVLYGGCEGKKEYQLTKSSTYIGKTARTDIQYKGAGLFNPGPDIAAAITSSPEGYCLVPIKEGFVRHNGNPLTGKVMLKDDDIIDIGITKLRFFVKKP